MDMPEKLVENTTAESPTTGLRQIPSDELLQGERQVVILHHGEAYRLLVTRNDKLLLQK